MGVETSVEAYSPQRLPALKETYLREIFSTAPFSWPIHLLRLQQDFVQASFEWARLYSDRIRRGEGVPRGHGEPIITDQGFGSSNLYMAELHRFLARIGYDPQPLTGFWDLNTQSARERAERILDYAKKVAGSGHEVKFLGHSKGGSDGLAAVKLYPDQVRQVFDHFIFIDALLSDRLSLNPVVGAAYLAFGHSEDDFALIEELLPYLDEPFPEGVAKTVINSVANGVLGQDLENGDRNTFWVQGSHAGMVFNHEVYWVIANRLANPKF